MALQYLRLGKAVLSLGSDVIALQANLTTVSRYMTLQKNGAGYQVTAGKTLYLVAMTWTTSGTTTQFNVGYGDTSVGEGAVAPTSFVLVNGGFGGGIGLTPGAYVEPFIDAIAIPIPATKYACIFSVSNVGAFNLSAWGFEA